LGNFSVLAWHDVLCPAADTFAESLCFSESGATLNFVLGPGDFTEALRDWTHKCLKPSLANRLRLNEVTIVVCFQ
jgi:hypothetical protein